MTFKLHLSFDHGVPFGHVKKKKRAVKLHMIAHTRTALRSRPTCLYFIHRAIEVY